MTEEAADIAQSKLRAVRLSTVILNEVKDLARSSARHVPLQVPRLADSSLRSLGDSFLSQVDYSNAHATDLRQCEPSANHDAGVCLFPLHSKRAEDRARSFTSFRMTEYGLRLLGLLVTPNV